MFDDQETLTWGRGGGGVSFCNLLNQTFILPTFVPVFCCFCWGYGGVLGGCVFQRPFNVAKEYVCTFFLQHS